MNPDLRNGYQEIDWDRLLMRRLGEAGQLDRIGPSLGRIKKFFDRIQNPIVLSVLPPDAIQDVENHLNRFIDFTKSQILAYSDVSQRDDKVRQIQNEIGGILNALQKYTIYFDALPVEASINADIENKLTDITRARESELNIVKDLKVQLENSLSRFNTAQPVIDKLNQGKDSISQALEKVESFVAANEKAVAGLLERNATSFAEKANEHCYSRQWVSIWMFKNIPKLREINQPSWQIGPIVWLFGALIFGGFILSVVGYFIFSDITITLENTILRVSALVVPSYFAVLFVGQYLNQRRLHEAYKFKDIALQTMIMLRNQFPEHSPERTELLRRSMSVIFSEPSAKEEVKIDRQLIMELVRMVRDRS